MKQAVVLLLLVLLSASMAHAQVTGGAAFPVYGPSMSVIDHNGNLLIFDVNYTYPTTPPGPPRILSRIPTSKTRLTVVRIKGPKDAPKEFEGNIQVLGAGYYAVYVILSSYTAAPFTTKRQLMAINVDSAAQPVPLDVPLRAEVKLLAATDVQHLDTLSFVDPPSNPMILAPMGATPTAPAIQRFARLVTCDGNAFSPTDPVPLP
jgi:hypothetical protein